MDKVKVILKVLQKYHFWLLCAVAMITGMVGWMMASRTLSAAYTANKAKVVAKFTALKGIQGTDNFPNSTWKEDIDKMTKQEVTTVSKAWVRVYDEQQPLLHWPTYLGERFLNEVKKAKPGAEFSRDSLERYGNDIKKEFPELLKIANISPHGESRSVGATVPAVGAGTKGTKQPPPVASDDHVTWDSSGQQEVERMLAFPVTPSSAEVWLTQEDLWTYGVLLQIIHKVNGQEYVPPIKNISKLLIGVRAADAYETAMKATDHIEHPATAAVSASTDAGVPAPYPPPDASTAVPKALDDGRYLDKDGKSLAGGSVAKDPFKRMPIVMHLKMDQRVIPKLLVECANSPLPVEVTQLRINPGKGGATARQGTNTQDGGPGAPGGAKASSDGGLSTYDVPIEVYGIIYIYNPPDAAQLGDATAPGVAPASAPPAAPSPQGG